MKQAETRRLQNKHVRTTARGTLRDAREAVESGTDVEKHVRQAQSQLNRAASSGVIPKRRAARLLARLAKAVARAGQE
jgi:small subunit ribosomal protein S20